MPYRRAPVGPGGPDAPGALTVGSAEAVSRDAWAVTPHQVTYQGPPAFALRAATVLADSDGVELTSANQPEVLEGADQIVLLALVLEGTSEAVMAALDSVRSELPPEATVTLEP